LFWEEQRSCDGQGGAQRPVGRGNAPKKTGARSAQARTRGQNPLVYNTPLLYYSTFCLWFIKLPKVLARSTLDDKNLRQNITCCTYFIN